MHANVNKGISGNQRRPDYMLRNVIDSENQTERKKNPCQKKYNTWRPKGLPNDKMLLIREIHKTYRYIGLPRSLGNLRFPAEILKGLRNSAYLITAVLIPY